MQLSVICRTCSRPVAIANEAAVRSHLPAYFTLNCTYADCAAFGRPQSFASSEVKAAAGNGGTVGGALVAGVVGALLGGPLGLILGGVLGGGLGKGVDNDDGRAAARFNES